MSSSSKTRQKMKKKQTPNNGTNNKHPEISIISSSSSPSIEELIQEQEDEVKSSNNSNQNSLEPTMADKIHAENTMKKKKSKKSKNRNDDNGGEENGISGSCAFPIARINRIIRSEAAADIRFTHESIFLINKATENFLELFCEEVYANVAREKRKAVDYKHLASVVSKCKRYDFLSDFVPEKIKAEDALSERLAGL